MIEKYQYDHFYDKDQQVLFYREDKDFFAYFEPIDKSVSEILIKNLITCHSIRNASYVYFYYYSVYETREENLKSLKNHSILNEFQCILYGIKNKTKSNTLFIIKVHLFGTEKPIFDLKDLEE